jgi:hypothetical protein
MAGHIDVGITVRAPLATTWSVTNDVRHYASEHRLLGVSDDGRRVSFQVTAPFGGEGRTWTYNVERCQEPEQLLVYARRWGSPHLVYAVAWWLYEDLAGATRIRTIQDFEMATGSPIGDARMQELLAAGTRRSMERMKARVEAADAAGGNAHVNP